jgi:DUF1680 family protein
MGKLAFMRGPILFCAEAVDNTDLQLLDVIIDPKQQVKTHFEPRLLDGLQVIEVPVKVEVWDEGWRGTLYRLMKDIPHAKTSKSVLITVPYFAWGNRKSGQMQVWFKQDIMI